VYDDLGMRRACKCSYGVRRLAAAFTEYPQEKSHFEDDLGGAHEPKSGGKPPHSICYGAKISAR